MRFKAYLKTKNSQRNLRAIGFFVAFYVGLLVFTTLSQERLVYIPSEQIFTECPAVAALGLVPQETNDTRFYSPPELASSSTLVLVYHGNAGSACNRSYYIPLIEEAGGEAILIEYAGYSNDKRPPSHDRIKQDVQNMITWLESSPAARVIILGESIGTGPAILHASVTAPDTLILVTPFTSLKALAGHHYWYFPTDVLVHNAFDNTRDLAKYAGPRTIIHGVADSIVPFTMAETLAALDTESTTLVPVPEADHNNLLLFPAFDQAVTAAIRETI